MPKRKQYLWVCENTRPEGHPKGCCSSCQSEKIRDLLKKGIAARGLHGQVRICGSSCLDLCWVGPVIAVMPDHAFYGRVTENDVPDILNALEKGQLLQRLLLNDSDFDEAKED
ncbi:MAG: (2Fe-2S) ferredoxin domain-containing protein [Myxococcales bacterium]|nr:MAG: (2Fe-2S) ferredoxin domain-containing protein [Myxococcales bacterium]